jgi:hypothetical protein
VSTDLRQKHLFDFCGDLTAEDREDLGRLALKMDKEKHRKRHCELHESLDELLADFITHTNGLPSRTPIMNLLIWSKEQTEGPTP